jgi:hypothetical protein
MIRAKLTAVPSRRPDRLAHRRRDAKGWFRIALAMLALGCGVGAGGIAPAGPVLPDFDPGNFVAGAPIDNPFYPLVPGTVRTYQADVRDPDTGETTREVNPVTFTSQTRTIAGVTARVVRDRSFEDGVLAEDTLDYFAQDKQGNVWYLGEDTKAFEYDDDGRLIGTSTAGSWRAGVDGAKPGFIMPATHTVGFNYYQEFAPGSDALDQAEIVSLSESATVPVGSFDNVLKTRETSEAEPGVVEFKFYAAGVGELLTLEDLNAAGEPQTRVELISVTTAAAVPLPPAAWAALAAGGVLLLPRALTRLLRRSPA